MPKTVDHYLSTIIIVASLSNKAKIYLTPRAQLWNQISNNQPQINNYNMTYLNTIIDLKVWP